MGHFKAGVLIFGKELVQLLTEDLRFALVGRFVLFLGQLFEHQGSSIQAQGILEFLVGLEMEECLVFLFIIHVTRIAVGRQKIDVIIARRLRRWTVFRCSKEQVAASEDVVRCPIQGMLINPEVRNMLLLIPIQAVVDYVIEIVVKAIL